MIIQCTACQARYHYDETRFAGAPAKRIKCTKCANVFEIRNPAMAPPGMPASARPNSIGPDEFSLDETAMTEASKRRQAGQIPGGPARSGMLTSTSPGDTAGPSGPPPAGGQARTTTACRSRRTRGHGPAPAPARRRAPLARVHLGTGLGRIFEVDKPRVVIGRANATSSSRTSSARARRRDRGPGRARVPRRPRLDERTYVYDQRIGRTELRAARSSRSGRRRSCSSGAAARTRTSHRGAKDRDRWP